jgi:beta-lactamase class A
LVSINPYSVFHAASTIKVPILYTVLSEWDKGNLSLEEKITLTPSEKVGGCGVLKIMCAATEYSLVDLLTLMICISDNTATNMLIERFGIDLINSEMSKLGLKHTHLARKLMITDSSTYSKTTAFDLALLFGHFSERSELSPKALKLGKEILLNQQQNNRLNLTWNLCGQCGALIETANVCKNCGTLIEEKSPIPLSFYHKTGEIVGLEHDAGLLTINEKDYTVAVLSSGHDDNYEGKSLLSQIGNIIIQELL